jgi:hypothetical protein
MIKIECKNIIGTLPKLNTLHDVIKLKENKHRDIVRLRQVLGDFEMLLRITNNKDALSRIMRGIQTAKNDLNKGSGAFAEIGKWITILSVPIAIAETLLFNAPLIGLPLGVLGAMSVAGTSLLERKNGWINVIR